MTPDQLRLMALLAESDVSVCAIAEMLGVSESAARLRIKDVYAELGVHSRPHLRSVLLECELAPVGAS